MNNNKSQFTRYHTTIVLLMFMVGQAGGVFANITATNSVHEAEVMLEQKGYTPEEVDKIIMDSVPEDKVKLRHYVDYVTFVAIIPYLFSLLGFFIFRFTGGLEDE